MLHPRPLVTVIVCTRDRPDSIGPTLDSLARQSLRSFEAIVVDQSRSGATREIVEERGRSDGRFHYLRLTEPGLSRAYNAGIRAAMAETLAFTDDDCTAPEDWLSAITSPNITSATMRPPTGPRWLPPSIGACDLPASSLNGVFTRQVSSASRRM